MEMPNDINTFDSEDIGLKAIFGDRFHDATANDPAIGDVETAIARSFEKAFGNGKKNPEKAVKAPVIEPNTTKDAKWKPIKPDPNDIDRLKASAKSALLFGGLCLLVFWWQQSGQMEASAALPSMLACMGLAGLNVGKNMKGR